MGGCRYSEQNNDQADIIQQFNMENVFFRLEYIPV